MSSYRLNMWSSKNRMLSSDDHAEEGDGEDDVAFLSGSGKTKAIVQL